MVHFNSTEQTHELWSSGIMRVVGDNVRSALLRREPEAVRVVRDWGRYASPFTGAQRVPHSRGGRS